MISALSTPPLVQLWCYPISATSRIFQQTLVYRLQPPTLFPPSVLKLRWVTVWFWKRSLLGKPSRLWRRNSRRSYFPMVWNINQHDSDHFCLICKYRGENFVSICNWTCNHLVSIVTVPLDHIQDHIQYLSYEHDYQFHQNTRYRNTILLCVRTPMYISHLLCESRIGCNWRNTEYLSQSRVLSQV